MATSTTGGAARRPEPDQRQARTEPGPAQPVRGSGSHGAEPGNSVAGRRAARRTLWPMRQEWHRFRNPGLEIGRPATEPEEIESLGLDHWRGLPRDQMPPWPDMDKVAEVCQVLATVPTIVAPYEVDELRDRLALVCEGEAFLLQGGDCAETFADNTEAHLLANARTLLQMAVVLS